MSTPENSALESNERAETTDTMSKRTRIVVPILFGASSLFYLLAFFSLTIWDDDRHLYFFPVAIVLSLVAAVRQYRGEEHEEKSHENA